MHGECYIMDAKQTGNIGRYLNHSCHPTDIVQKVFFDTHDLRFPWIVLFVAAFWPAYRNSPMIFHRVSRIFMVKFHRVRGISLVIFQSPPDRRHMTRKIFRLFFHFLGCLVCSRFSFPYEISYGKSLRMCKNYR